MSLVSLILVITMCVSNVVYASESINYEKLSQEVRMSTESLKAMNEMYGDKVFLEVINEYKEKIQKYDLFNEQPKSLNSYSIQSEGDSDVVLPAIGDAGVNFAISKSIKGSVWITKDGTFVIGEFEINHGHAALVYAVASWHRSTLEHRGSGNPLNYSSVYSKEYDLENDQYWRTVTRLRIYNVSNTENGEIDLDSMFAATDYAKSNLLGFTYAPLALKSLSNTVNCATFVYKAYADQYYGETQIYLGNPLSTTVIPADLVNDKKLLFVDDIQWGGDPHIWNTGTEAGGGGF